MSLETKKGYGSTIVMIVLGILALYVGVRWLLVLVPAAALVWRASSRTVFTGSRN